MLPIDCSRKVIGLVELMFCFIHTTGMQVARMFDKENEGHGQVRSILAKCCEFIEVC